jgi:D-alanine--poly(phosphoribitol) ligase subunit 1
VRLADELFSPSRAPASEATSLSDLFVASARMYGSRPALWVDGRTLAYAELYDGAARLAGAIQEACPRNAAREQGRCGLMVNRTPTAYAAVLGALMAGSAYVPLNPKLPRERLRKVLSSSAVDTLIVDHRSHRAAMELLESIPRSLTVILPDASTAEAATLASGHRYIASSDIERMPAADPAVFSQQDIAYIMFTSGSTGAPKGVPISHGNALAYVRNAVRRYSPCPEDRFSQLFDFSFDLSVHDMFVGWAAGSCVYCAPEGSLLGLGDFIRHCELTFWFSVPSTAAFMRRLRMLKPGSYPTLRYSLFCGEVLPTDLARAWQDAAPQSLLENLYGPTETTVAITVFRLPAKHQGALEGLTTAPIGVPLPGQQAVIVDECGTPVPDGEPGELCLGGSQVASGYWRAPEQTAARFQPPRIPAALQMRWYRTGDRARMTREHGLVFLGRVDRQAKIRGHRVELLEVENAMRIAAETETVAAVPWPVGEDGLATGIIGFIAGSSKSGGEIIAHCRDILPDFMTPSLVHRLDHWPININGKTDYQALATRLEKLDVGPGQPSRNDPHQHPGDAENRRPPH